MNKFLGIAASLLAGGGLMLAAPSVMARTSVDIHVGIPGVFVQPAPVYVQPRPVYVQPAPVYMQPAPVYAPPHRGYAHPAPIYVQPSPVYLERPYRGDDRHGSWRHRSSERYYDRDRDGVPNRWDRRPNNPYRY